MEQHNSDTASGERPYSPFQRVASVRTARFPDGSVETLVRFFDVQTGARVGGNGSAREVDPELRAERSRVEAERRAKRELRWALECIGADRIVTCTFHENLQDLRVARRVWNDFVALMRARFPEWKFAAVVERQERGALHFHAGVAGWQNVNYLRTAWRRAAGKFGGNINVTPEKRRWGAEVEERPVRRIASYLAKYLGKSFGWMPKGSRRFTASHDRVRPVVQRWWIQYAVDAEVIERVYRLTCG
jgi:hypothetical protein